MPRMIKILAGDRINFGGGGNPNPEQPPEQARRPPSGGTGAQAFADDGDGHGCYNLICRLSTYIPQQRTFATSSLLSMLLFPAERFYKRYALTATI